MTRREAEARLLFLMRRHEHADEKAATAEWELDAFLDFYPRLQKIFHEYMKFTAGDGDANGLSDWMSIIALRAQRGESTHIYFQSDRLQ